MEGCTVEKYIQCVSLGSHCGVAASMQKYGLRSWGGPFDWMISDFKAVIKVIDDNFEDFMKEENLQRGLDNHLTFLDNKYGFICPHDIKTDFESERKIIIEKYKKRANRFINNIENKTLFFRLVKSQDEADFIVKNSEYINRVIKKKNNNNQIVFLTQCGIKFTNDFGGIVFDLYRRCNESLLEIRYYFDMSEELIDFCNNVVDRNVLRENAIWDSNSDNFANNSMDTMYYVAFNDKKLAHLIKTIIKNEKLFIFGAGKYGVGLYKYLIEHGIEIESVIDNDIKKCSNCCESIMCITREIPKDGNVIIAVRNEKSANDIIRQIKDSLSELIVYTLQDLFYFLRDGISI